MNKPITIRVRTAMSSPAKVTAGDIMKSDADASKPLIGQRSVSDVLSGGNSSLISGASGVSGTSGSGVERADLTIAAPSGNSGARNVGDAIQNNLVKRIDKAGELGRARRETRRNKRAGIPESTAPSAEKAARDARVDNILSKNTSSSSLNNTMPKADFSGMGKAAAAPSAKADAAPSAKSIRQAGRAERAQVRQDNKSAKQAARIAGKNLKNTDRIFGKNNVEVTAAKPKSKRQVERDIKNTTLSTSSLLQGRSNEDSDTEANNFNPGFKNVKKSGVMSVPVDNVGPKRAPAAPSVDASKLPDASKLGSSTGNYTDNRSNAGSGKTTTKATPKKSSSSFNSTMEAFNSGSRIADGTPTREKNGSVVSAAQMRMNANVGIKSKSPMKKGYFNKK
tara:strand:- start:92 stop:1273 length:1182 start_codon:yes stop_codon:yes gene_type:complete